MILLSITLSGCAKTRLGKIDLSSESPPVFLKVPMLYFTGKLYWGPETALEILFFGGVFFFYQSIINAEDTLL